jgi:N-acyl-D-amino-acid deacylase
VLLACLCWLSLRGLTSRFAGWCLLLLGGAPDLICRILSTALAKSRPGKLTMGSDGLAHDESPHPRLWGSFPRVLGRYSREQKLFSMETAIHKMTGLSARRFGLDRAGAAGQRARGTIQIGMAADLVLLNPETVNDCATYDAPTRPSMGIECVYVNGRLAALHGKMTDSHAGRVLRRAQH